MKVGLGSCLRGKFGVSLTRRLVSFLALSSYEICNLLERFYMRGLGWR